MMARVTFTSHLRRVAPQNTVTAPGGTVGEVLAQVFGSYPMLRGYVLDDQDRLRTHIAVFVDNVHLRSDPLRHPVKEESDIYVMQALSGG